MRPASAKEPRSASAPRWMRAVVRNMLPADDRSSIASELDDLYEKRVTEHGVPLAQLWYLRQTFGFVAHLAPMRVRGAFASLGTVPTDARLVSRFLMRRPGYMVAFVLTLGIGAGLLSTAYTAANWMLLRPVPGVRDADALVTMRLGSKEAPPFVTFELSNPDFLTLREQLPGMNGVAATTRVTVDIRAGNQAPSRLRGEVITSNYFSVLHTRLASGRTFLPAEEASVSGSNVVIISDALARQSTNTPRALVGSELRINGTPFQVVGVVEPGFQGAEIPGHSDVWFPLGALAVLDPSVNRNAATNRGTGFWRQFIGRRSGTASSDAVIAAANAVMELVRVQYRGSAHSFMANHFTFQAFDGVGLNPAVRTTVRQTLTLIGLATAFLMLLAVANLANLTLTQAGARDSLVAVRMALGASRWRIAQGVLIETALLGVAGGIVGLVLSSIGSRVFETATLSAHGGSLQGMRMDGRVVAATLCIALVAAIVASARQFFSTRKNSFERLLRSASSRAPGRSRIQWALVATQVGLSLMLVVGASLLGRTVSNLRQIELGFDPTRLLTFAVDPHLHGFEATALEQLALRIEDQVAQDRSIVSSGFISPSPLETGYLTGALYSGSAPDATPIVGAGFFVTPNFFTTLGAKVLAGDLRRASDSASVVITAVALEQLFPGTRPAEIIGRMVPSREGGKAPLRVVAVIGNVQLSNITSAPAPTFFRPLRERYAGLSVSGFVRTLGAPESAIAIVRRSIESVAPELPFFEARSARSAIDQQFAERKVLSLAATTLGTAGVVLAVIGLYGVLATLVASERREIGIRVALGATPARVWTRVLRTGLFPTVAGIAAGAVAALSVSRVLESQLYGLQAYDIATYAVGMAGLLVVALVTCALPAWRATRIAPVEVMRAD